MKWIISKSRLPDLQPEQKEILIAQLADAGYEGFEEKDSSLDAFIKSKNFDKVIVNENVAAHARAIVDHHRLAGLAGDVGAENARGEIGHAAGRGRHDDLDRLRRVAVGDCGNGGEAGKGQDRQGADHVHRYLFANPWRPWQASPAKTNCAAW